MLNGFGACPFCAGRVSRSAGRSGGIPLKPGMVARSYIRHGRGLWGSATRTFRDAAEPPGRRRVGRKRLADNRKAPLAAERKSQKKSAHWSELAIPAALQAPPVGSFVSATSQRR